MTAPTVTEREAVLRERAAFFAGSMYGSGGFASRLQTTDTAEDRYPLPKITRRRVVEDEVGFRWSVSDAGKLIAVRSDGQKVHCSAAPATEDRIRLWADLLANPDEEVEA